MIKLRKLFTPVEAMDADAARKYITEQPEGTYTLLDVRQPWEYEEDHIPGAKLIPLAELTDGLERLDKDKPALVYCAVGGRSRVAAQLMSGLGFQEVYNLSGGIQAYRGAKATGPQELNLDLVRGDETPVTIVRLAFGMEKVLQTFYETVLAGAQDQELAALLGKLAKIEEIHKLRLFERYRALEPGGIELEAFDAEVNTDLLEGGYKLHNFLAQNEPMMKTPPRVLEVALMLETQALDLYLRLADRCAEAGAREVLFTLADEEKAHLKALADLLDRQRT